MRHATAFVAHAREIMLYVFGNTGWTLWQI